MAGESFYQPSTMLNAMVGHHLPGGCDDCDAYQELEQVEPGLYVLTVRHDATCPELHRIVTNRGEAS